MFSISRLETENKLYYHIQIENSELYINDSLCNDGDRNVLKDAFKKNIQKNTSTKAKLHVNMLVFYLSIKFNIEHKNDKFIDEYIHTFRPNVISSLWNYLVIRFVKGELFKHIDLIELFEKFREIDKDIDMYSIFILSMTYKCPELFEYWLKYSDDIVFSDIEMILRNDMDNLFVLFHKYKHKMIEIFHSRKNLFEFCIQHKSKKCLMKIFELKFKYKNKQLVPLVRKR